MYPHVSLFCPPFFFFNHRTMHQRVFTYDVLCLRAFLTRWSSCSRQPAVVNSFDT